VRPVTSPAGIFRYHPSDRLHAAAVLVVIDHIREACPVVPAGIVRRIHHHRLVPAPLLLGAALAVGLLAACGGDDLVLPTGEPAAMISVVDGDGQQGQVGELLPAPIVVEVTDTAGNPIPGAEVQFVIVSAGDSAQIEPASTTTDQQGHAEARMLLGDKVGLQTGEARVGPAANPARASFTALATSPTGNQPPIAGFDWQCNQLACRFTDGSTDGDGSVAAWSWDFGDGATSTEQSPSHTYAAAGTYTVTLTVTDNEGASSQASKQVTAGTAPPANQPPHAEFDVSCTELTCGFTDRSTDDHGITAWAWDFGDGTSSTEPNPAHTYSAPGTYHVRLTVTDGSGDQDSRTHDAHAESPPPPQNEPPDADFEVHCKRLDCSFTDRSKDDDGVIVSWHWDFGDGETSIQPSPEHTYARRGHYQVSLTVTDDQGATDTRTHTADAKR
jgi:PKD repeat protein